MEGRVPHLVQMVGFRPSASGPGRVRVQIFLAICITICPCPVHPSGVRLPIGSAEVPRGVRLLSEIQNDH